MTHSTHTPGPWVIYGRDIDNNTVEICQSGIKNIAKRLKIAEVLPQPHYNDNQEANARLIKSAPELLGALKLVHHTLMTVETPNSKDWDQIGKAVDTAKQAIAKAEGRR